MDIFDKLKEQHKTIILVTHDEFISGYADRIVRIEDGEITENNKSRIFHEKVLK